MAARQPCHCGCDDFRATSESTRRRFVGDSQLTRRQIFGWGVGAGLSLYAARAMPISRALEAAAADAAAAPDAPVLVAVFLPGGLDLLDSLIPLNDYGAYADLHRNIRVDKPPLLRGSALGIHPSLTQGVGGGIKGLYDAGKLGFLPGIDYPEPEPLALPLAPLLGDRADRRQRLAGLARALAGRQRQRRQPAAGDVARLRPVAGDALAQRARRVGELARQRRLLTSAARTARRSTRR